MRVRVLFFGPTADLVGKHEIEMQVVDDSCPGSIAAQLTARHEGLRSRKLLFAVNEEYADDRTSLKDGDSVAIFTPVSGG
jgi:sulfur-carrier protein